MANELLNNTAPKDQYVIDYDPFFKKFREFCYESGKTQKEVANALHITESSVTRYLRGERVPTLEYVYRFSRYFGMTMEELLGLEPPAQKGNSEAESLWKLYSKASDDDRAVIALILNKYKGE